MRRLQPIEGRRGHFEDVGVRTRPCGESLYRPVTDMRAGVKRPSQSLQVSTAEAGSFRR